MYGITSSRSAWHWLGSAASLMRILEKQNHLMVNAQTMERNLTHLQQVLLFKDSSEGLVSEKI
jgi:hypothetical protein